MDAKKIKIYALILAALGLFIGFLQVLKLNDIGYFIKTSNLSELNQPSLLLNYMFVIILVAILISFFILIYFGLQEKIIIRTITENKDDETIINSNAGLNLEKVENAIDEINHKINPINDKKELFNTILKLWAKEFKLVQGIAYEKKDATNFKMISKYAYYVLDKEPSFILDEGLTGQVASEKKMLYVNNIPENYITILSGLGSSSPKYLALLPIIKNDETIALLEITAFSDFQKYLKYYYEALNKTLEQKL
jgi:hypothetical protein